MTIIGIKKYISPMYLLCLTGVYPSLYIANRIAEHRRSGLEVDIFRLHRKHTWAFQLAKVMAFSRAARRFDTRVLNHRAAENLGVSVHPLPVTLGLRDYCMTGASLDSMARQISRAIDIGHYDLLHVHWAYPEGAIGARIAEEHGIPFILTLHGSDIHTQPRSDPHIQHETLYALHSADRAIFVSRALLDSARELGYDGRNAVVIPNGVNTALFRPLPLDEVTRITGIRPAGGPVVGFIGTLAPVKRADALPSIFEHVARKVPATRFVVLGTGPLKDSIESQTRDLGLDVIYPGVFSQDRIPYWMNLMDVLILPSRNEGYGLVIIEAHACGIPVVGSDRGGIPEALGDGGLVVQDGDDFEARFADAVITALRTGWSRQSLRESTDKLVWSAIARREREVYQEVLAVHRNG